MKAIPPPRGHVPRASAGLRAARPARRQPEHLCCLPGGAPLTSPLPLADGEVPGWLLAGGAAGLLAGRHHPLAHLPRPVPLPDGGGHQPVLPDHHPAPGERWPRQTLPGAELAARAGPCWVGAAARPREPCPVPLPEGASLPAAIPAPGGGRGHLSGRLLQVRHLPVLHRHCHGRRYHGGLLRGLRPCPQAHRLRCQCLPR